MNTDNWLNDLATSLNIDPNAIHGNSTDQSQHHPSINSHSNPVTDPLHTSPPLDMHNSFPKVDHLTWHQTPLRLESEPQTVGTDSSVGHSPATLNPLEPHAHYNPQQPTHDIIIGNPQREMQYWHLQATPYSCGISTQQSGIESITQNSFVESQLRAEATARGWYQEGIGTAMNDFGKLLATEAHVPVETHTGGTIAEIGQKLAQGEQVFVGVNSQVEWSPDKHSLLGQIAPNLTDTSQFAGQSADHVVQVIGEKINPLDPLHPTMIVNDSGSPNGQAVEIPAEQFQQAMNASQGYIASTNMHDAINNSLNGDHPSVDNSINKNIYFGCEISKYEPTHSVWMGDHKCGTYNGDTFYWNSGKLAGHWDCAKHHVYTQDGVDLGYAKTWNDAALLIYKRDY